MQLSRPTLPAAASIFVVAIAIASLLHVSATFSLPEGGATPSAASQPAATPTRGALADDGLPQNLVRSESGPGDARVAVTWLSPDYLRLQPAAANGLGPERYLIFQVVVDDPALRMSVWDLKEMVFLRDGTGKEYGTPTWVPREDGSRKSGTAGFPRKDARDNPVPYFGARYLEIVIRGLPGPAERVFRWDLSR